MPRLLTPATLFFLLNCVAKEPPFLPLSLPKGSASREAPGDLVFHPSLTHHSALPEDSQTGPGLTPAAPRSDNRLCVANSMLQVPGSAPCHCPQGLSVKELDLAQVLPKRQQVLDDRRQEKHVLKSSVCSPPAPGASQHWQPVPVQLQVTEGRTWRPNLEGRGRAGHVVDGSKSP